MTKKKPTKVKAREGTQGQPSRHDVRYRNVGRKSKMTPELIEKLEKCFALSYTDEEACLTADIDMATLYLYCQRNPDFSIKKELLKRKPNIKAKNILINNLNDNDSNAARWWLERKAKDEFALRTETTGKDGGAIENKLTISQEDIRKLADEMRGK